MAQIKLTYFNLRARAEPARLVLAYAGAKYEDVRLPAPWDNPKPWAALKPTTPYGQCPLLEWDGEVIAQSMAITRLLQKFSQFSFNMSQVPGCSVRVEGQEQRGECPGGRDRGRD